MSIPSAGSPGEPAACHDEAMTPLTIRLAAGDTMRAITSQNLHEISRLSTLYIPLRDFIATETDPDALKHGGVAHERTLADYMHAPLSGRTRRAVLLQ